MRTCKNVSWRTAPILALTASAWIANPATAIAARATPDEVVAAYLDAHQSLAGDSATEAAASAKELAAAARALGGEGKHSKELEAIAAAAERMKGSDLNALRSAFESVSRAMAAYLDRAGIDLGLYYCPMKDAYWLQRGEEIENPYYGKSMLGCGQKVDKVKER